MVNRIRNRLINLTWAQRFLLASLVILLAGMAGIGAWVGQQIETGVVHRTAATTALYVDSVVAPDLQDLASSNNLSTKATASLDNLFHSTPLGQEIVSFKIWSHEGRVLYSTNPTLVGQVFPIQGGLAQAWQGQVAAELSPLDEEENVTERAQGKPLLEIYSPVRRARANDIIAVAEFYQSADALLNEVTMAIRGSWLLVAAVTLVMYLLLAGFVQRGSNTMVRQQSELSKQLERLRDVLHKNADLDERVRRAAAQSTASNELVLRRISAELHDGPAQDLGLAMLNLDNVMARAEAQMARGVPCEDEQDLNSLKHSLDHALKEIRAISGGLGVPQLDNLTLGEIVRRVVRTHERRTLTQVEVHVAELPAQSSLPIKIALYRVIQEALTNAFRHANGIGQRVQVDAVDGQLKIQISDRGPGSNGGAANDDVDHLGIVGMRERVESLGGTFELISEPGNGTRVLAHLPLQTSQGTL